MTLYMHRPGTLHKPRIVTPAQERPGDILTLRLILVNCSSRKWRWRQSCPPPGWVLGVGGCPNTRTKLSANTGRVTGFRCLCKYCLIIGWLRNYLRKTSESIFYEEYGLQRISSDEFLDNQNQLLHQTLSKGVKSNF